MKPYSSACFMVLLLLGMLFVFPKVAESENRDLEKGQISLNIEEQVHEVMNLTTDSSSIYTVGSLSGIVTDATNGLPLANVTVEIAGQTTTTSTEGSYSFNAIEVATPAANFSANTVSGDIPLTIQFNDASSMAAHELNGSLNGYSNYFNDLVVITAGAQTTLNFSLSPVLTSAQMRIVLSWGETPRDMDSHLLTPEIEGSNYHIYYGSKGDSTSAPYALLDHDDTSSFGPETTTITQFVDGLYYYYVYNYSGSPAITTSQGKVQFYNQSGLFQTVRIPENGEGGYWLVATINGATGQVTVVNQIQSSPPNTSAKLAYNFDMPIKERVELTASIDSWAWTFGDGTTSTLQNPEHTYTTAGSYSVALGITIGEENYSITKENYITALESTVTAPEMVESVFGPVTQTETWQKFTLTLNGEEFGVTDAQMQALLQNVTKMRIRTETRDGTDYGALDSVSIGSRFFSGFNNNTENWSVDGDGTMYWMAQDGVDNGHISISDWANGDWHYAVAPVSWSGNWSELFGQTIEFWFKSNFRQYPGYVQLFSNEDPRLILSTDQHLLNAGQQSELFLTVNPIPINDLVVAVSSSNTSIIANPGEITITAGSSMVSIPITVAPDATPDAEIVFVATASNYSTSRLTVKTKETAKGILFGQVIDATTGGPLANVAVHIAALTTQTDNDGNYRFENVPIASPTVRFSGTPLTGNAPLDVQFTDASSPAAHEVIGNLSGYSNYVNDFVIIQENAQTELNFSMSPVLTNAKMRIVLSWASIPADLDSHLKTPQIEGTSYHIYYNEQGDSTQAPYVVLDRDDTNGFGPETTTITTFSAGIYHYYVHNYSESPAIKSSEAKVQIYGSTGLTHTIRIPQSGEGLYWHVADIDGSNGTVQVINTISQVAPGVAKMEYIEPKTYPQLAANIDSWLWTFGDGSTSTEQNPSHTFTQTGNHTISLTVTIDTTSYMVSRTDYVKVTTPTNVEVLGDLPRTTTLYQNYPNPFNPTTTIQYDLSKAGFVRLVVYDILGKPLQVLESSHQSVGKHFNSFNASSLSTGVYFYILEVDNNRFIKRMTLIK